MSGDNVEIKHDFQSTDEYKEFEKVYKQKEARLSGCRGCIHEKGQPGGMCGLASASCVNSTNKPFRRLV